VLTLFVLIPFYRSWRRVVPFANDFGLALVSLVFPILYTATFFLLLSFPGMVPLGDFPHPTYTWTSVHPLIMFASCFGIHGIIFVVTWSGVGAYLLTTAPASIRKRARPVLLVMGFVALFALSWGSIQALAAEGSFLSLPTRTYAGDDVTVACVTDVSSFDRIDFESKVRKVFFNDRSFVRNIALSSSPNYAAALIRSIYRSCKTFRSDFRSR
jgi:apolipoprotein N-acyltransferase